MVVPVVQRLILTDVTPGSGGGGGSLPANPLFVLFAAAPAQSNEVSRAELGRMDLGTIYPEIPANVLIYFKPDYSTNDNGSFIQLQQGTASTREPDQNVNNRAAGPYGMLATRLAEVSNDTVYIIMMADGGTALQQNLTNPDWSPLSSGECYDIALQRYFLVAYNKIVAANPGRNIVVVVEQIQGEADGLDNTATANYGTNIAAFMTAARAFHPSLATALWITTKIHYLLTPNETTINNALEAYIATQDNHVLIDVSDQPRKIDLTTEQKLGVAPTGNQTDDEHLSVYAQVARAERGFSEFLNHYGVNPATVAEHLTNTQFTTQLGSNGCRLQGSRSNLSLNQYYAVASSAGSVTNTFNTGSFTTRGVVQFKVEQRRGWIHFVSGNPAILSSAAIGTALIQGGVSHCTWLKPRDGNPTAAQWFLHDVRVVGTPNDSRIYGILNTNGTIEYSIAVSGTLVRAVTASPVFTDGIQGLAKHICATFDNVAKQITIYVNGVAVALDAANPGALGSMNLSNYANANNPISFGSRRTGASTFDLSFAGYMREIRMENVVWTPANIANIMTN